MPQSKDDILVFAGRWINVYKTLRGEYYEERIIRLPKQKPFWQRKGKRNDDD